jgi:hypothetical protein
VPFIYRTMTVPYSSLRYPYRIRCSSFEDYLLRSCVRIYARRLVDIMTLSEHGLTATSSLPKTSHHSLQSFTLHRPLRLHRCRHVAGYTPFLSLTINGLTRVPRGALSTGQSLPSYTVSCNSRSGPIRSYSKVSLIS